MYFYLYIFAKYFALWIRWQAMLQLAANKESRWRFVTLALGASHRMPCIGSAHTARPHGSQNQYRLAHQRAKRKRPSRPAPSLTTQLIAAAASPVRLLDTPSDASRDLVVNTLIAPALIWAGEQK